MMNRLAFFAVIGIASVVFCQPPAEEQVDNPEYQILKGVKAGTVMKIKMTGAKTENGKSSKMEMVGTSTVKAVTAEKIDIHVEGTMTVDGKTEKDDEPLTIPAKIAKSQLPAKAETGEGELTVGQTKYKCTWEKYKLVEGNKTTYTKYWICKDISFQLLKTEQSIEADGKTLSELVVEVTGFDLPK